MPIKLKRLHFHKSGNRPFGLVAVVQAASTNSHNAPQETLMNLTHYPKTVARDRLIKINQLVVHYEQCKL
jgi:hypothetical protein